MNGCSLRLASLACLLVWREGGRLAWYLCPAIHLMHMRMCMCMCSVGGSGRGVGGVGIGIAHEECCRKRPGPRAWIYIHTYVPSNREIIPLSFSLRTVLLVCKSPMHDGCSYFLLFRPECIYHFSFFICLYKSIDWGLRVRPRTRSYIYMIE